MTGPARLAHALDLGLGPDAWWPGVGVLAVFAVLALAITTAIMGFQKANPGRALIAVVLMVPLELILWWTLGKIPYLGSPLTWWVDAFLQASLLEEVYEVPLSDGAVALGVSLALGAGLVAAALVGIQGLEEGVATLVLLATGR